MNLKINFRKISNNREIIFGACKIITIFAVQLLNNSKHNVKKRFKASFFGVRLFVYSGLYFPHTDLVVLCSVNPCNSSG